MLMRGASDKTHISSAHASERQMYSGMIALRWTGVQNSYGVGTTAERHAPHSALLGKRTHHRARAQR